MLRPINAEADAEIESIPNPLLTREEVAQLLGIRYDLVSLLVRNGLPAIYSEAGNPVRYHRAEVLDYWRNGRRQADTTGPDLAAAIRQLIGSEIVLTIRTREG